MEFIAWQKLVNDTYTATDKAFDELIEEYNIYVDFQKDIKVKVQSMKENLIAMRNVAMIPHTQKVENEY